ncbi:MATE family efflux transporter [Clostridium tertium]|uniref:MATE family efflux transporter n=1 Tax=Clostridium TaxID=1485 RepID=UPI0005555582|nr:MULTISPECIES: MATE family efflux transporter [Clostridium]MBS5307880.1 MATE family efflux transporter [Clostridium sp.]MBU6136071.1 MATE family efflux transporter [Clostridium tertium]MDB1921280.1 MATE family efflux transporter [Clostridium tertium]MDB1924525.1 MATE family efflux transporter [Clostridium tertium]MDB1928055.1 MATE family efflux transporter [Clostridium tertium]
MTKDMTTGNPVKLILLFSIPLLIGNIFQQFYSMVDTIIVGRFIGVDALAAVGSTGSMSFLINGFVVGLTSGFAVLVSQKFGAKDEEGLKKAVASALVLALIATGIVTLVSVLLAKPMLHLMNTPDNIIDDANAYIIIIYAGTIATVVYNIIAGILRALGDSKTPLYFLIVASILNIVLDIVFIVNFSMGVAGAAWATIISQGVSGLLCIIYTYKKYKILRLKKEDFKVKSRVYKKHLKIGIPMALQFSITAIGIMTVQGALNVFGSSAIAAYTAASKVLQIVMQPAITFGVTMATYCGQNLGAKNYIRIKEGVKKCTEISVITSIIAGIILVFGGKFFVGLFIENPDASILAYAQECLNYSAIFFIPLGLIFIYRNALQGMGESFVPMMAGAFELIARAVVAFTLPSFIGYTGICLADPVAWLSAAIPLGIYYFKKMKSIDIIN